MSRFIIILQFIFVLLFSGMASAMVSIPLMTDSDIQIGEVQISNDATYLAVKFVIANDPMHPENTWCLQSTLVKVSAGGPDKLFNTPGIGNSMDCVVTHTVLINKTWPVGKTLYIAATADVLHAGGADVLDLVLPASATVVDTSAHLGDPSYFKTLITDGGILNGESHGWCMDPEGRVQSGVPYVADVYSTLSPLPPGAIEIPEKANWVNWIIEQEYVGKSSPGGFGNYTFGDVQRAIWETISTKAGTAGLQEWSQDRANEIIAAAAVNGPSYVPGCEQSFGILLVPRAQEGERRKQVTITRSSFVSLDVPCESEEATASIIGKTITDGKDRSITFVTYAIE